MIKEKNEDDKQNLPTSKKEELPSAPMGTTADLFQEIQNDSESFLGKRGEILYEHGKENLKKIRNRVTELLEGKRGEGLVLEKEIHEQNLGFLKKRQVFRKRGPDMAMDNNKTIQEMWANLIVNSMDSSYDFKKVEFYARLLSEMSPDDAMFIQRLGEYFAWEQSSQKPENNPLEPDQVLFSENLVKAKEFFELLREKDKWNNDRIQESLNSLAHFGFVSMPIKGEGSMSVQGEDSKIPGPASRVQVANKSRSVATDRGIFQSSEFTYTLLKFRFNQIAYDLFIACHEVRDKEKTGE